MKVIENLGEGLQKVELSSGQIVLLDAPDKNKNRTIYTEDGSLEIGLAQYIYQNIRQQIYYLISLEVEGKTLISMEAENLSDNDFVARDYLKFKKRFQWLDQYQDGDYVIEQLFLLSPSPDKLAKLFLSLKKSTPENIDKKLQVLRKSIDFIINPLLREKDFEFWVKTVFPLMELLDIH